MSIARNQHWVPRFYLNGFCTAPNSGSIHIADVKAAYAHESAIEDKRKITKVAASYDLYNFNDANDQLDGSVDHYLGDIERAVVTYWKDMIETGQVPDMRPGTAARKNIALFMAAQHMRTPHMIAVAKYSAQNASALPDINTQGGRDLFYAQLKTIPVDLSATDEGMDDRIEFRDALITYTNLVAQLIEDTLYWTAHVYPKRELITSDTPISVLRYPSMEPGALVDRDCIVFFPMTAKILLICTGRPRDTPDGLVTSQLPLQSSQLNPFIAHFSTQEAYSPVSFEGFKFLRDPPVD